MAVFLSLYVLVLIWAAICPPLAIIIYFSSYLQVIVTNQITTRLSNGLDIQADLISPADELSLSEGRRFLLSQMKLDTDTDLHYHLQSPVDIWEHMGL